MQRVSSVADGGQSIINYNVAAQCSVKCSIAAGGQSIINYNVAAQSSVECSTAAGGQSATAQERSQSESCLHCVHLDVAWEKLRSPALNNVEKQQKMAESCHKMLRKKTAVNK